MLLDRLKDVTAAPIDIYKSRMKIGKRETMWVYPILIEIMVFSEMSTVDPVVSLLDQVSDNEVNETEEYR